MNKIPAMSDEGLLPPGLHDCTPAEVRERFGRFQGTARRCDLVRKLDQFLDEVSTTTLVAWVVINGSFVTDKDAPNDIDLILVLKPDHDYSVRLRPFEYNMLSRRRVQKRYGFDILVAAEGTETLAQHVDFFEQVRGDSAARKGLLRIFP